MAKAFLPTKGVPIVERSGAATTQFHDFLRSLPGAQVQVDVSALVAQVGTLSAQVADIDSELPASLKYLSELTGLGLVAKVSSVGWAMLEPADSAHFARCDGVASNYLTGPLGVGMAPSGGDGDLSLSGSVVDGAWRATVILPDVGGTGLSSYTVGDLIYASGATTLSKLADVATGRVLVSGGVGVAPAWAIIDSTYISDFTEAAQDAVGGAFDATLVYTDGSNSIGRAALSGDASASAGSNTLTLATVNANVGTFGSATQVAQVTVNAKGLVTAASNVAIAVTSGSVTDFNEAAQDAVGAMVDASLTYVDGTPLLQRAALTGDVTAAAGSNATTLATTQPAVHTWQGAQTFEAAGVQHEQFTLIDADGGGDTAFDFASQSGITASGRGWRIACSSTDASVGSLSIYRWNGANMALVGSWSSTAPFLTINGGTVWHSGNDGAGSGLDADTVDGLNPSTVGGNFLTLTNPSAITFPRINADNTVTARSAANFLTDLGATADAQLLLADSDVPRLGTANSWTGVNEWNVGGTPPAIGSSTVGYFVRATAAGSQATQSVISGNTSNTCGVNLGDTDDEDAHGWYVDHSTGRQRWRVETVTTMTLDGTAWTLIGTGEVNTSILAPAQITGNTDDYAPTGHAAARYFRLSTDASRNLTGLQGGVAGRRITISNTGAQDLVLVHDSTSTAANRFYCPDSANITLDANDSVDLWYDGTSSRWRVITPHAAAGAGGSLSDGDYGDITVGGTGTTLTIDNDAVTYAKLQNASAGNVVLARANSASGDYAEVSLAASRLLGRGSSGDIAAISVGDGLTFGASSISGTGRHKLGTATVAGSAATVLTLSGLDLSLYRAFEVFYRFDNATGSNSTVSLYYNADTTATNYNVQNLTASNTTLAGSRANSGAMLTIDANETNTGIIFIQNDFDGKPRANLMGNRAAPASIRMDNFVHVWNSATNITGITFSGSVASSLAIGSTFTVYGVIG